MYGIKFGVVVLVVWALALSILMLSKEGDIKSPWAHLDSRQSEMEIEMEMDEHALLEWGSAVDPTQEDQNRGMANKSKSFELTNPSTPQDKLNEVEEEPDEVRQARQELQEVLKKLREKNFPHSVNNGHLTPEEQEQVTQWVIAMEKLKTTIFNYEFQELKKVREL